jgi:hypothetical protein
MNDNAQGFEARFGPQAMLINATVQLPPIDRTTDRGGPARIEFLASANAASDPKQADPTKHVDTVIPAEFATSAPAYVEESLNLAPPIAAAAPRERTALAPLEPIIVAAIESAPVPAKDPQVASDAPAQPGERIAVAPPAAPAAARPTFSDTSRTERMVKPAIKKRAQIKRPKRRVVRAPAPPAPKPRVQTPTNPFAALFGPTTTH